MHELSFGKLQSRNRFRTHRLVHPFATPRRWQGNDLDSFEVNARGFTIIELLLVILIISIIGLMSASFYSRFLTQNAVDNTVNQLVGSFRKAQTYSMMGKQNGVWGVRYTTSPNKITLYLSGNAGFDESFAVNDNITVSGFTDIIFARITGAPSTAPSDVTITISGNNNSKTITVNSQGVVSKQ